MDFDEESLLELRSGFVERDSEADWLRECCSEREVETEPLTDSLPDPSTDWLVDKERLADSLREAWPDRLSELEILLEVLVEPS